MRNKMVIVSMILGLFVFLTANLFAQDVFTRMAEIPMPEADLNNGGCGNMVSGVDLDGDGALEIYLVNDNWNDGPSELIPRIYKLEKSGGDWQMVWHAVPDIPFQNTWPPLAVADLDKDGKQELIWGVINFTGTTNPNPPRVLVYECKGDGSDVLGVDDGSGGYKPNASWTIAPDNDVNLRPTRWIIADPDNDGTNEIIFSDRTGTTGGYFFGVMSVSDIPDNGDGSETWTLETSGKDHVLLTGIENKWDVAAMGSNFYFFCEIEIAKLSWDGSAWNYASLSPLAAGASFISSQVLDLDGDDKLETICGIYDWGDDSKKGIYLLQEEGDTLKATELVNTVKYWPSGTRGIVGGAHGDIDQDGKMDFVFGSRASTPNAGIFRLEYQGGDITSPASYEFSIIDSLYREADGIWSVINLANVDDDPHLEVLYASSSSIGDMFGQSTPPIVILDLVSTAVEQQKSAQPADYALSQNYPNPFNPNTAISYSVPTSTHVTLKIYNVMGKEIKTLVNETRSAGIHSVTWDGTNNAGQKVTSGIYFYSLKADNFTDTKQMILMK